jgi:hypothetical protein
MAKFGLFDPKQREPVEIWDGDYMHFAKPYVTVFLLNPNQSRKDIEIIVIRLKAGYSVRKIED